MQTQSHFLMTAALNRVLGRRQVTVRRNAFLLGAVLPDIPFWLLTIAGEIYYRWFAATLTGESPMVYLHMRLYFTDPLWIISHNMFHAPFILLVLGLVGWLGVRNSRAWGASLCWFVLGAGLHALIDILTHHNDGPLLFFPFDWHYRFPSPISYWDPAHYGAIFMPLELALDGWFVIYLLAPCWRQWCKQQACR
jgi:membrane-bound metal-dependent hydrolase YbcI (DUF457 family)